MEDEIDTIELLQGTIEELEKQKNSPLSDSRRNEVELALRNAYWMLSVEMGMKKGEQNVC